MCCVVWLNVYVDRKSDIYVALYMYKGARRFLYKKTLYIINIYAYIYIYKIQI